VRVRVAARNKRGSPKRKEAREGGREIRPLGGVRTKREAEKLLARESRRVGPVTRLCTRGPSPLSARGGLISRPYRIRHDNRPNIHTNAVPGAPTVQRGPPMKEAERSPLAMSKRSFRSFFFSRCPFPVACFLPLTSRVSQLCWGPTVSRETFLAEESTRFHHGINRERVCVRAYARQSVSDAI